ncbi:MAG: 4-hydroxythreonine-4-phosphate dehydrogenase PdxA [Longimicrobiales bacterium]|jgi:4-hydroxythreonine-4-phosphate dehydrogenase|nr:4-hydroxythreonine-4-phosphate dehydrogenase PdxA [Longimicrobiales bacterium]
MTEQTPRPIIAITIGDPAGVGPETVIKALAVEEIHRACRPLVFGDLAVLERSLKIVGSSLTFREFTAPAEGAESGVIPVVDLRSGGETAPLGQVSPAGGVASFSAIRHAVEFCQRGDATAMVTGPINKESLREADVPYLDHTAALEGLTGSTSALTMFMTGTLRVFFMTRHLPFREIAQHVTKQNVISYTRKCDYQMLRLGFPQPKLAVAALNPHNGEHGMFGDEEIREIMPAVEQLRSQGLDVHGPVPADAVFHLAKEGVFDAVISLYHDQGHIATKTLDFYRTVSLTLGLPFLRTSVDHGTAFDIAGTGKASEVSMVEAILTAAAYGPSWRDETEMREIET